MLCCDAAVVPIVLDGKGQPLDVGRATRVIPDGLRRAVAARDGGCGRCGRPSSWCEVHHVIPWEQGGQTSLANCVMVCRACHRARRRPPRFPEAVTGHSARGTRGGAARRLVSVPCATGRARN